jgi:UDP-N-acetylglucosamine 4-epimerase
MTNDVNISGFLVMLRAAQESGVESFVYAASSSTYGDSEVLPKIEERIGNPLSPYAVTKRVNEMYADVFLKTYGFRATGLRYFNVFGRRQDPDSTYAAVIPQWVGRMLQSQPTWINGDGETSRDFCYIDNVIQANLLAATAETEHQGLVYNVGVGDRTTLAMLHEIIREGLEARGFGPIQPPELRPFRAGDVRHSQASIDRARTRLGYEPTHDIRSGLREAMDWYIENAGRRNGQR